MHLFNSRLSGRSFSVIAANVGLGTLLPIRSKLR